MSGVNYLASCTSQSREDKLLVNLGKSVEAIPNAYSFRENMHNTAVVVLHCHPPMR